MRVEQPQLLPAMDRVERVVDVERDSFGNLLQGLAIKSTIAWPMRSKARTFGRFSSPEIVDCEHNSRTNDMTRSAVAIAALYKARWQIELLFPWIKQHLKFRKFLGQNENAIKLQIYAAMIAYALLRLAATTHKIAYPIPRFTDLVRKCLFERSNIAAIERPPPVNPSRKKDKRSPDQLCFCYAGISPDSPAARGIAWCFRGFPAGDGPLPQNVGS